MTEAVKQKVIAIVGPTASGKTSLAIELAKQHNGEVISADSRQVYRRLDHGTAKATAEEMRGVPHHLIDIVEVEQVYTATDFKRDATEAINDITLRGKVPIIAGGTFFYLDQLKGTAGAAPVEANEPLRADLEENTTEELLQKLKTADPRRAAEIDPDNRRRLIRALEIIDALGAVPEPAPANSPYDFLTIGLAVDKETLREKFKARAAVWLSGPFETEVRNLLESGIARERLQEIGFEYLIMLEYIDGELTDEQFIQKCIEKNWQYAKRQMTWLKRDDSIKWFTPTQPDDIFSTVRNWLND